MGKKGERKKKGKFLVDSSQVIFICTEIFSVPADESPGKSLLERFNPRSLRPRNLSTNQIRCLLLCALFLQIESFLYG